MASFAISSATELHCPRYCTCALHLPQVSVAMQFICQGHHGRGIDANLVGYSFFSCG